MTTEGLVSMVYGYSRSACRNTPLDYRDVAHNVIVAHLTRFRNGRIRHVSTYMYICVKCAIANAMRNKYVLGVAFDAAEFIAYEDKNDDVDLDAICRRMTKRECFVLAKLRRGHTRDEIAEMLGLTRAAINTLWHRMVHRIRAEVGA